MKKSLVLTLFAMPLALVSQDAGMPTVEPPAEMAALDYLVGTWKGKMTVHMMGGAEAEATMTTDKILNGRFFRSMHSYTIPGLGDMTGMHLRTYDSLAKTWLSWWYDSTQAGNMEMSGNQDGATIISVSKPTEIPGMGKIVMRETFTKVSDKEISTKLEMKEGDGWSPAFDIAYTKQ